MPDGDSIVFTMGSEGPYPIIGSNLKTQDVSKIPGSDGMGGPRVSRDGRYMTTRGITMLYDFQSQQWSEFSKVKCSGAVSNWSFDSKSLYGASKMEIKLKCFASVSLTARSNTCST